LLHFIGQNINKLTTEQQQPFRALI